MRAFIAAIVVAGIATQALAQDCYGCEVTTIGDGSVTMTYSSTTTTTHTTTITITGDYPSSTSVIISPVATPTPEITTTVHETSTTTTCVVPVVSITTTSTLIVSPAPEPTTTPYVVPSSFVPYPNDTSNFSTIKPQSTFSTVSYNASATYGSPTISAPPVATGAASALTGSMGLMAGVLAIGFTLLF